MTGVDDQEGILISLAEVKLFSRVPEEVLFFNVDWKAKVVQDVECLVAVDCRMVDDQQVVVGAHICYLRSVKDSLTALMSDVFHLLVLLVSKLAIDAIPYSVPLG